MAVYEVTDPNSGVTLELQGDSPPTEAELEEIFAQYAPPSAPEDQSTLAKYGEPIMAIGSAAIAEPVAGVAGILETVFGSAEGAPELMEGIKEQMTYDPRTIEGQQALEAFATSAPIQWLADKMMAAEEAGGEFGYEKYGALGGAAGAAAPTAAIEAIPFVGPAVRKAIKARKVTPPKSMPKTADDIVDYGDQLTPELSDYEKLSEDLKRGKVRATAEQVMPDAEILEAADRLNVQLNPDAYSTNRTFKEMVQGLKSRPGSKLSQIEEKAIIDTGRQADELIKDLGGTTDKSLLSESVKEQVDASINALSKKSDDAYARVNDVIPKATQVKPENVAAYITEKLDELGGDVTLLNAAETKLARLIEDGKTPTYAALDRVRKDIGNGFNKKQGPFKEDNSGTLKQIYKVISEDQQNVSNAFGVGADYSAARKLVSTRKGLEDEAVKLFGKEVNSSLVPKITTAATGLTKGDTGNFKKLMSAVPEARRQEVAATMLNDLFTNGQRNKGSLGQGFVAAYDGLNRNKAAKAELFKYLPEGAKQRFDDLGKVATGIYKAKALENKSKTARDLIAAMDDGGMFGKVAGAGKNWLAAEGATSAAGFPGVGTTAAIGGYFMRSKTPKTAAAENLLTSKKFADAIDEAAKGNIGNAQKILDKSRQYKDWLAQQPTETTQKIAAVGFVPWVTDQGEEDGRN